MAHEQQPPALGQVYSDPNQLARLGTMVRTKLNAMPEVQRIPTDDADLYFVPNFLIKRDCRELVRVINERAIPSVLFKGTAQQDFRTSWTCHFDADDPLTSSLEDYIADMLGIDICYSETMQGQRYSRGQQYRAHHDFFNMGQSYWANEAPIGGQRTWTAMVYLNEPAKGGETVFPLLDTKFSPQTGTLVVWNNMDRDGHPNMKTLHAAIPVESGVKHVITKWFRLGPWRMLNNI